MERYVKLTNGQEYRINRCGAAQGVLWIGFPDGAITFQQAVAVFGNPELTAVIESRFETGMEHTFANYTDLVIVQRDENGILIAIRKINGEGNGNDENNGVD